MANKSKAKKVLDGITKPLDTKKNLGNSALEVGKDLLFGVVGAGAANAAAGRASLPIGVVLSGIGHYTDLRILNTLGLGMMASATFSKMQSLSGEETSPGIKERFAEFEKELKRKFFIDLIKKPKSSNTSEEEKPVGEIIYLEHPSPTDVSKHIAALDKLEADLIKSAQQVSETPLKGLDYTSEEFSDAF